MFIPRLKIVGKLVIATTILSFGFSISVESFNFLPFQSINQAIAQNSLNTRQQKRIALVIGNANYQVGKLGTPLNDATDMAAALKELGFEVILLKDSSKREMNDALDQFSTRINQGYVGLFYYAGHGMQVEGENYLIPVNAQIKAEKDVEYESMPLGKILGRMESADNQINIVILDACRDNPFRKFSRSSSRGLTTPVQPASGTLIVFATAPGKVASDGMGRNGLFTSYLLKYIKTPNLDVDLMLRQVRSNVAKDTKNYQVPWNSSSLTGDFAFNQTPTQSAKNTPIPKPTSSPEINVATLTPPQETKTKNSSSSQDITPRNFSIFQGVPVFIIANDGGSPLVAIDNNEKTTGIFISQREAQKFFQELKKEKPDIAAKVKVTPVSLGEVYKLAVANKNKPDSLNFAYIPISSEVESAKQLLAASGKKYEGGVPVYAARGGKDNGYLTIQQNNEQVIPFFFERKQIEEMVNGFKRDKPDLASTVTIDILSLENVISTLETSNDSMLGTIRLVPSEESLKFIRSVIKNN